MKNKFKEIEQKLFLATEQHKQAYEKLCEKIDKSNGQIHRAILGGNKSHT